ncbi:MAG: glycosyltransferase [Saccharofermentanales bacterium]|jgi:glycosyltransferase involved in cell wall biosynthesis|nr:glycosyltransferase [Bacillota bacterium]
METEKRDIIIFTDGMGNCGIQRVLSELTESWIRKGHKILIVYNKKIDAGLSDYSWSDKIEFIEISVKNNAFSIYYKLFRSYLRLLNDRPAATAVSLSVMTNFVIGACAPFVNNRIVISDRNDPDKRPRGKIKQFIRNQAFKQADVLILQTDYVQKYYEKKIHKKGIVIPNPISRMLPPIKKCPTRRPVIVTAGRLNKQKNLTMLIKAFFKLVTDYPEYELEIYGRGEEEENLKSLVKDLDIADNVSFKGFSKNLYNDIIDSSIYVCSSDYEGISNSVLEALGLGIPVISTDCPVGGSRLLIEHEVNGILVNVGDVDALYMQMKRLIDDPRLCEKLSGNAIKVREKYNVDRIAQLWIDSM